MLKATRATLQEALNAAIDTSPNVAAYGDMLWTHPTLVQGFTEDVLDALACAITTAFPTDEPDAEEAETLTEE